MGPVVPTANRVKWTGSSVVSVTSGWRDQVLTVSWTTLYRRIHFRDADRRQMRRVGTRMATRELRGRRHLTYFDVWTRTRRAPRQVKNLGRREEIQWLGVDGHGMIGWVSEKDKSNRQSDETTLIIIIRVYAYFYRKYLYYLFLSTSPNGKMMISLYLHLLLIMNKMTH